MVKRRITTNDDVTHKKNCFSSPTVYHAATVIFLEFFAFGLLTTPMISVLDETFPKHTFLMNGIIQGVKGFLSFLSAPLLGALSDAIGRKPFLLITVTFTCSPIPLMKISHWWYFTITSISGIFAVTFSVVLAYVADITTEEQRSWAYGLVSATFAASLVTSPAIGAYLGRIFSEDLVVALATAIACLDIFFILACVPESLPDRVRASHACSVIGRGGGKGTRTNLSWDKVDPFSALRKLTSDHLVLIICITTFFSYLPEAGQYSCFFVYLRLAMGFSEGNVALFIAVGGILACVSQTVGLNALNTYVGPKRTIIIGLILEATQLTLYGFATHPTLLWFAGSIAAMGSLTYPALSAFVSKHAAVDQQGGAQGLVTGIRGLCGGLGPALFGLIFYIFRVDLNTQTAQAGAIAVPSSNAYHSTPIAPHLPQELFIPGAPFAFGAMLVLLAIFVAWFIPENPKTVTPINTMFNETPMDSVMMESNTDTRFKRSSSFSITQNDALSVEFAQANNDVQASSSMTCKSRSQSPYASIKDHFILDNEHGICNRAFFHWSSNNRHLTHARRPHRLFRQPTVSFTRAHFVEPIRRLIAGFMIGRSDINDTGTLTQPLLSTQTTNMMCCDDTLNQNTTASHHTVGDTEEADLSNYRNHEFKHLLTRTTLSIGTQRNDEHDNGRPILDTCCRTAMEEKKSLLSNAQDVCIDATTLASSVYDTRVTSVPT